MQIQLLCACVLYSMGSRGLKQWVVTSISHMGQIRDSDWSRRNLLRSDWLLPRVAPITTFLAWLFSWMIRRRRREGSILLSSLLFYGPMVGKYALICAMEIQKIHMVNCSYLLRICFIYGTNVSVSRSPSASCWPLTRCLLIYRQTSANQNTVRSLNGVRKRRLTAKETSIANCELLDEKYRIAVQRIFVGIIIKAGGLR